MQIVTISFLKKIVTYCNTIFLNDRVKYTASTCRIKNSFSNCCGHLKCFTKHNTKQRCKFWCESIITCVIYNTSSSNSHCCRDLCCKRNLTKGNKSSWMYRRFKFIDIIRENRINFNLIRKLLVEIWILYTNYVFAEETVSINIRPRLCYSCSNFCYTLSSSLCNNYSRCTSAIRYGITHNIESSFHCLCHQIVFD